MNNYWLIKKDFKTIIDIGANEGQFARRFMELFPKAEFHCFEPLAEPYEKLTETFKDKNNFHLYNFALGDKTGHDKIFRNEFSPSSSILPMEKAHKEAFPFTELEFEEEIEIKRLDDVFRDTMFKKPLWVKIDVQGFEAEVIKGGLKTISMAEMIMLETSFLPLYAGSPLFDDIYELLKSIGFKYQGSFEQLTSPQDGGFLQQDSLFIRDKDHKINTNDTQSVIDAFSIKSHAELSEFQLKELSSTKADLNSIKDQLRSVNAKLNAVQDLLDINKGQLDSKSNELMNIYRSRGWLFITYARKAIDYLIPKD